MNQVPEKKPPRLGPWRRLEGEFGISQLIREYMIPAETNNFWYTLGGVLAISLTLEVLTGMLLTLAYTPDAGKAYTSTKNCSDPGLESRPQLPLLERLPHLRARNASHVRVFVMAATSAANKGCG